MTKVSDILANRIIISADTEVQKCTDSEGKFDPSLFDRNFYLEEIYNFLKDNTEITVIYTGSIPGVGPDPANGNYKFGLLSIGTGEVTPLSDIIDFQTVFNDWWTKLFSSLILNTSVNNIDIIESGITLTASPLIGFPKPPIPPDVSDIGSRDGYKEVWKRYSEAIVTGMESMTLSDFTTPTATASSSNGGTGTITPVSVKIKEPNL
jgi:hypothetical protein